MGLWDNNEKDEVVQAEKREKDFVRERDTFNSASADDGTYIDSQDRKSDLLRWQQEFGVELEELYNELIAQKKNTNGEWVPRTYKEYDEVKRTYITKNVKPLCNPRFAEKVIAIAVKPWLNKNAVNSNLSEKVIVKMLRSTHNDVAGIISDSWGMNGIISVDDANVICRMIKNYVDPAAYRAISGWTKKTDSSMIKRIESQQDVQQQEKKSGMWGILSG